MGDASPVLAGRGLRRSYAARGSPLGARGPRTVAVDGVDIALGEGELAGLLGRSGSGKSTLARLLAGLESPDGGEVAYGSVPLGAMDSKARRAFRRAVQIVFQDPAASLDPRMRVGAAIGEPLEIHRIATGRGAAAEVGRLLEAVGLPSDGEFSRRLPRELSGGERQRVAIARTLAVRPSVLLLDEPVASLDLSVRGQVMNLLLDLRQRLGLTMLLIAHDLALVRGCCERVSVLLGGRVVEEGPAAGVLARPRHPYTASLTDPATGSAAVRSSSRPDGLADARGCRYRAACPWVRERCVVEPELAALSPGSDHRVACWYPAAGETRESEVT